MEPKLLSQIVTRRQYQILAYRIVARGYTWRDIALKFGITDRTAMDDYGDAIETLEKTAFRNDLPNSENSFPF